MNWRFSHRDRGHDRAAAHAAAGQVLLVELLESCSPAWTGD